MHPNSDDLPSAGASSDSPESAALPPVSLTETESAAAHLAPAEATTVTELDPDDTLSLDEPDPPGDAPAEEETDPGYNDKEMSLVEHLEELRSRILKSIASWVVASCALYYFAADLLKLTRPMLGDAKLIFTSPTEAFFVYLKIAMIGGLFVSIPLILYQAFAFVAPGLKSNEKKWLKTLVPVSILLFAIGAAFAYFVVVPVALKFFLSYSGEGIEAHIKLDDFMGFLTGLICMCGVVFQLPLVLLFLALIGIVSSSFLARQRRIAIFLAFVVSAIVTPTPDAVTCTIVAIPIILLFEISIWLIWMKEKWSS